jgi:hypothetical protein
MITSFERVFNVVASPRIAFFIIDFCISVRFQFHHKPKTGYCSVHLYEMSIQQCYMFLVEYEFQILDQSVPQFSYIYNRDCCRTELYLRDLDFQRRIDNV